MTPHLTLEALLAEARSFADTESGHLEPALYGVTDGKAIGTYLEQKLRTLLKTRCDFTEGNSAQGIDFPSLGVDMKATSKRQPQSSCPFKSAWQRTSASGTPRSCSSTSRRTIRPTALDVWR